MRDKKLANVSPTPLNTYLACYISGMSQRVLKDNSQRERKTRSVENRKSNSSSLVPQQLAEPGFVRHLGFIRVFRYI